MSSYIVNYMLLRAYKKVQTLAKANLAEVPLAAKQNSKMLSNNRNA